MVFSLANLLFILSVILTNLWSLPISAFVIISQFVTIPLWLLNVKSAWFLVSPSGDSQVQYLFFGFWNSVFAMIKLCSSANSIKRFPLSFLSPIPNAPMLLKSSSFVLVPIFALKSSEMILYLESLSAIALSISRGVWGGWGGVSLPPTRWIVELWAGFFHLRFLPVAAHPPRLPAMQQG